ncbi:MAG TPA: hybrid sensor histidine kinase/response regulator [Verrucomicrobiae bacterium]|nr:hybrid sensor histidine kinase/response regulator [Verrucomicrobiae bacterium]
MQSFYDYKKFAILYVDDEEKSLKYFTRAFEDQFRIFTANNAQDGFKILEANKDQIGVLITDQRMPGEKGVWLLEKARQLRPRILRMLATAFADMDAAIASVNSGSIFKYITKPWDPPQLESTLKRGLEFFIVQRERDQLLKEKMSVLYNMMIADRIISLGLLAAGLSHHIRNSLVAVKTFLDLAPSKLKEENIEVNSLRNPDFWREYYQNVQGQIERINSLLKDLWVASEQPAGNTFADRVLLKDIISEVAQRLEPNLAAKKLKVENLIPPDLPPLTVERAKFSRLFELLLKDEIVSLPQESTITLTANSTTPDKVEIEVKDNGPGLPQESLRLLFDPFVVRSDSPLEYGINLMACYFIVHHHSGEIAARSEPGRGTCFTIRIPTDANQPAQRQDGKDFLQKILLNDSIWEKLIASNA